MTRNKRDIRPALLKVGVPLAISVAGFLYSRIQRVRPGPRPRLPPPSSCPPDQDNEVVNSEGPRAGLRNDPHVSASAHASRIILSTTVEKNDETYVQRVYVDPSAVVDSPSSGHSGDKGGLLLPEFEDIVKELDFSGCGCGILPKKQNESPQFIVETPRSAVTAEREFYEQEIAHLKDTVRILTERERSLEFQLLEYYGLKEQETALMELQNRLKINNMEAQLFCMRIESLEAENRRLEANASDYAKVVSELETARSKIRVLKKKLKSEAEQTREQILLLQKRVAEFQDRELKSEKMDADRESTAQNVKLLQHEIEELTKSNAALQLENSELHRRLESTQILANCVLEDPEAEALKREGDHLRREIESLKREVEQQRADRCADVEELVYLKWINACLRYELRNYQPPPGKPAARDLSKTLSPKSEEKAKRLILDYGGTEGIENKAINFSDFDSDRWSSSQASYLTDSGELDEASLDDALPGAKSNHSKKNKLFGKLRMVVSGKEGREESHLLLADKTESPEAGLDGCSFDSSNETSFGLTTPGSSSRHSLDIRRLTSFKSNDSKDTEASRRSSDVGSIDRWKESGTSQELAKYAKVLKDSRDDGTRRNHRKVQSFSSFSNHF
ncbi:hypothetical protein MLD38_030735 [Melastoma candidum]|uniref:Uncharacterized protein n=1 Tax=Melastoma candidum TaxID=119954 RepID=A0ACB9MNQ2_9MYRT|nr:hypothetical protein MLD38_030735 [Melastoma candidum]